MQTMPTFVYLAPLVLLFAIGPASATIATFIYAAPPVIRITAHGIRQVPRETIEAAESLGTTRPQMLLKVTLPVAKRTVVIGINQTIMAALSMVTLAALIDAPGLGRVVLEALNHLDIGTAFNGGLAIVIMAIVFDRVTTAASVRSELARRHPPRHPTAAPGGAGGRRGRDRGLHLPVLHLRVGGGVPLAARPRHADPALHHRHPSTGCSCTSGRPPTP